MIRILNQLEEHQCDVIIGLVGGKEVIGKIKDVYPPGISDGISTICEVICGTIPMHVFIPLENILYVEADVDRKT